RVRREDCQVTGLLERFIAELRNRGVRVSPAEGIEATRAALEVGIESRSAFRIALEITLAKSLEDRRLFDDAFEAYFTPPRFPRRPGEFGRGGFGVGGTRGERADAGKTGPPPRLSDSPRPSPPRSPSRPSVPKRDVGKGFSHDDERRRGKRTLPGEA